MSLWTLVLTLSCALVVVLLTNVFSPKNLHFLDKQEDVKEKNEFLRDKKDEEGKILEGFGAQGLETKLEDTSKALAEDYEKKFAQLKTEFLAVLSHELKTPLVSVVGYLDLIHSGKLGEITDRQRHALDVSLKKTALLNSLITSILNLAKLDAGKLELFLKSQKLIPIILESVDSLKPMAERKKLDIQISHEVGEDCFIFDAALISRVILNLLENAIKYSHEGGKIEVKALSVGADKVKIEIADQGIGIPAEMLGQVKLKFFQVSKTEAGPKGGLGIGLALAEKILSVHNSGLEIDSEVGKGSCFSFLLKRAEAPEPLVELAQEPAQEPAQKPAQKPAQEPEKDA